MNVATDNQEMTKFGMPLTVNGIIEQAQNRLRQGWTKLTLARNDKGEPVDEWELAAVSWCFVGAINRAYIDITGAEPTYSGVYLLTYHRIEYVLFQRYGHKNFAVVNDDDRTDLADILGVLSAARQNPLPALDHHLPEGNCS